MEHLETLRYSKAPDKYGIISTVAGDVRKKNQQQLIFPSVLSPATCFRFNPPSLSLPLPSRSLRNQSPLCPQAPRATGGTLGARGGLYFVLNAEVGRAFDTGGVFSARGETLAARGRVFGEGCCLRRGSLLVKNTTAREATPRGL